MENNGRNKICGTKNPKMVADHNNSQVKIVFLDEHSAQLKSSQTQISQIVEYIWSWLHSIRGSRALHVCADSSVAQDWDYHSDLILGFLL